MWIADAHRGDGKRFVVRTDERLTAFVELRVVARGSQFLALTSWRGFPKIGINHKI
jgi:hypothetical protein